MDAVAQITKTGFTFLFERATGEPVFPIEEKPVASERSSRRGRLADTAAAR